jgi:hypothetical protein
MARATIVSASSINIGNAAPRMNRNKLQVFHLIKANSPTSKS